MVLSLGVTRGFHDTVRIGNALGRAIVSGMLVTTCLMSLVIALGAWHYGTMKKYEFDLENKVSTVWITNLSPGLGVSRVLIFVSFKCLPVPFVSPSRRYLIGRVGPREYKIYRCIVRYGYCDHIRDIDDFEEQIIGSIGEFISLEENDSESLTSPEGRMIVVGRQLPEGNALIPLHDMGGTSSANAEIQMNVMSTTGDASEKGRRKKVRFTLPATSPKMRVLVREELQELIEARESGTAYFLGQSHLAVRDGSNFLKQFLIMMYVFFDKNCREPHVALNIPHAALAEVGMVYTI
ncbi:hypothetical protein REPUB_Repub08aG0010500 [Reevesia pubescens]